MLIALWRYERFKIMAEAKYAKLILNTTALKMLKPSFAAACNAVFLIHQEGLVYNLNNLCFSFTWARHHLVSFPPQLSSHLLLWTYIAQAPVPLLQQWKLHRWSNTKNNTIKLQPISGKEKEKKEGEGKETWEKVQSNSVTSKSKKAEIVIMFSIEKMKVIKKEFFLQMKIIGDYSSICRR